MPALKEIVTQSEEVSDRISDSLEEKSPEPDPEDKEPEQSLEDKSPENSTEESKNEQPESKDIVVKNDDEGVVLDDSQEYIVSEDQDGNTIISDEKGNPVVVTEDGVIQFIDKEGNEIAENVSNLISSDSEIVDTVMDDMGKKQPNRYLLWIAFGVVLVVLAGAGIVFRKKKILRHLFALTYIDTYNNIGELM